MSAPRPQPPPGEGQGVGLGRGWQTVRRARWYGSWPRYGVGIVVVLLVALGVRSLIAGPAGVEASRAPAAGPDVSSEDFAVQFARAYLTYEAARPAARTKALAPYVGEGFSAGGGFSAPSGSQRVLWADVASDQRALTGGRVITVAAAVSGRPQPIYLAVTVRHLPGRPLVLGSYPSVVGAPAVSAGAPESSGPPVEERAVKVVAERVLRNYLAGDAPDLKADLTADAQVTLPTVQLELEELESLEWVGRPGSGAVLATIAASDPEGDTYTLTYELGVVYRERPYVDFVEVVPTDG